MTVFAVLFGLALLGGLAAAFIGWWRDLPKSIPSPATPFQAKAVADMKQAVKEPSRPMDASETEIIMAGNDMQADRLTQ